MATLHNHRNTIPRLKETNPRLYSWRLLSNPEQLLPPGISLKGQVGKTYEIKHSGHVEDYTCEGVPRRNGIAGERDIPTRTVVAGRV